MGLHYDQREDCHEVIVDISGKIAIPYLELPAEGEDRA
jgi:hypothetical protein